MNRREVEGPGSAPLAPAAAEAPGSVPAPTAKRPVLSATAGEWRSWMVERGYPAYRARQVLDWVIRRRAESFERMSDLPKALRHRLDDEWTVFGTRAAYHDVAPDGTDKLVVACRDGRRIECVLMAEGPRRTVCISTQVGCGMGCVFCASGLKGVERNLTSDEILEQVLHLRNLLPAEETISHVVVMGMGESLANLDNLARALDRLCSAEEGLGISQRRVTISTVGLPEKILKLAAMDRQYHLAVSLHAPTEDLRNSLVPVNEAIGLTAVMAAADAYFEKTGRQVTYEYVLLGGVNDRTADAQALGRLLMARRSHVNLIPYNSVAGLSFARPEPEAVDRFVAILRNRGVSVTVRKTKGRAIDAACGQLRRRLDQDRGHDHDPEPGPVRDGSPGRRMVSTA
jgi:23S rRNA (adenine2503-C2)-methyltransferase